MIHSKKKKARKEMGLGVFVVAFSKVWEEGYRHFTNFFKVTQSASGRTGCESRHSYRNASASTMTSRATSLSNS